MVIELMRQFYTTERTFRILGANDAGQAEEQFVTYSNEHLASQPILNADGEQMVDEADNPITRMPIFDIDVKAQKTNPYSKLSQNETASNLYQMGVFNPENAQSALMMLSMMDFEGKAEIVAKVSEGQTLMNQIQQMQAQMQELMGFIQMLRTGSAGDSSAMVQNDGTMGGTMPTDAPSGRISGNPIEVATKGAERTALTDYGQELVDRGNNIEE
jgi:hypothetical protein